CAAACHSSGIVRASRRCTTGPARTCARSGRSGSRRWACARLSSQQGEGWGHGAPGDRRGTAPADPRREHPRVRLPAAGLPGASRLPLPAWLRGDLHVAVPLGHRPGSLPRARQLRDGPVREPRGLFELIFGGFGVTIPAWAQGPSLALVGVALFTIWKFVGFQVVLFLAGLGNISNEYYEAARLDGASERQIFTKITLPLLSPTTFFVFTVASIGVLRSFDSVYVLTNGGPLDTTRTVTLLVFRTAFQQAQFGLGSALAFIL